MSDKIRIYAINPIRDGLNSWGDVLRELLSPVSTPDVEVTLGDLPDAPIKSIQNAYDCELVALHTVRDGLKAEEDGYDAVVMTCLDEPGFDALKEVLHIPVTGAAQASMHVASLAGRRFSYVLGGSGSFVGRWGGGHGVLEDLASKYGFSSKLASIRTFPAGPLDFAAQKDELGSLMLDQAQKAVDEDGADVIIGYGGLDVIGFLQDNLHVPVVSPAQASVVMASTLARLNLAQSKRAYPKPSRI